MPTGLHPDQLSRLIPGLTISSIVLYVNPSSAHLFLCEGQRHAGILTLTATDEGELHIGILGPHVHESPNDKSDIAEHEGLPF